MDMHSFTVQTESHATWGRETFAPSLEEGKWRVEFHSIHIKIPHEMEIWAGQEYAVIRIAGDYAGE